MLKEPLISARNTTNGFFYKTVLKPIYFILDPEFVHDRMLTVGSFLGKFTSTKALTGLFFNYQNKQALAQNILGIEFSNPLGLAAGFDKEAELTDILPRVGFGFEEVGSITGEPCQGNPKPRLWRLIKSKSLVVYYGLKNGGCEEISKRLAGKKFAIPIGVSVAKTNCKATVNEQAGINDYVKSYRTFVEAGIGSYYTINISCPNAFGGEPFTDPVKLDRLLSAISQIKSSKPIFLKMPVDLAFTQVDQIIEIARKYKVSGFVCGNLTKNRNNYKIIDQNVPENGGMSGKAVQELSDNLIRYIYQKTRGEFVIMGCGGVFTAEDAYRKIRLGASLIQLITGMIFGGPQSISDINLGLVKLLKRDGFTNISQAIGADNR